jgi:hypothetical protein
MARYGVKTNLSPSEVIEEAVNYFKGEWGLDIVKKSQEMVCFESKLGHVTITICRNDKTDVDLETREFDNAVKEFMTKI